MLMVYLLIVLGIFALEYNLKNYTDSHRLQGAKEERFGGKLILRNYHNSEGGFGIFKKNPQLGVKISGVVLVYVIWEFVKALFGGAAFLVKLGLSLVTGGGLSNYYDRVTKGYVTDYFSFGVKNKKLKNTVFNLSDFFIFIGAVLFVVGRVFAEFRRKS